MGVNRTKMANTQNGWYNKSLRGIRNERKITARCRVQETGGTKNSSQSCARAWPSCKQYTNGLCKAVSRPNRCLQSRSRKCLSRIRGLEEEVAAKKSSGILRKGQQINYEFIYQFRFEFAIRSLCQVLEISRSGYYEWVADGCPDRKGRGSVILANPDN